MEVLLSAAEQMMSKRVQEEKKIDVVIPKAVLPVKRRKPRKRKRCVNVQDSKSLSRSAKRLKRSLVRCGGLSSAFRSLRPKRRANVLPIKIMNSVQLVLQETSNQSRRVSVINSWAKQTFAIAKTLFYHLESKRKRGHYNNQTSFTDSELRMKQQLLDLLSCLRTQEKDEARRMRKVFDVIRHAEQVVQSLQLMA